MAPPALLAALRADLVARGLRAEVVGYGALARAYAIPGPGSIAALAAALEALMAGDAAAGHPFLAALLEARGRGGLPAPGFFDAARGLGRYDGPDHGPLAIGFVAAERHALWSRAPDADWAFARYEALRGLYPVAGFPDRPDHVPDLAALADRYDAFVLDAFGVLNIGETPIPGAVPRIAALRAMGKRVVVLTNGASQPRAAALAKYHRLGFDFTAHEVVASRDLAAADLGPGLWAAIAPEAAGFGDIAADLRPLAQDRTLLQRADGFVFLGSEGWTAARQAALIAALRDRPRPLVVANPDIVAPRETGLTLEPGHFAAVIAAETGIAPRYVGKPFGGALEAALARIGPDIPRHRIAMVGDTLHTDVLGGRAAGVGTVLIAGHGFCKGRDVAGYVARSGIVPDAIAATT